jgi:tRNA uridine 5-carboxymethylaminomethyl modification enzyme
LADLLYSGYIKSQRFTSDRIHQNDGLRIPNAINYHSINGLSHEMVERLDRARPQTFGQARRISGLTPAALSTLLVYLNLPQTMA